MDGASLPKEIYVGTYVPVGSSHPRQVLIDTFYAARADNAFLIRSISITVLGVKNSFRMFR